MRISQTNLKNQKRTSIHKVKTLSISVLIILAFFMIILSEVVCANTYYVDAAKGNDGFPGTLAQPFKTIQKAADSATPGTTVHVAPGVYNSVLNTASGTSSNRIVFISDVKYGAKITSHNLTYKSCFGNEGDYVDINGFEVTDATARLGIASLGSYVSIRNNHVHNIAISVPCDANGGAAIVHGNYTSHDNDSIGNLVHDIGPSGGCATIQGIYHSQRGGHIQNNIVYNIKAWGIHTWHGANGITISNNLIFNCGSSTMKRGGGIIVGNGENPPNSNASDFMVSNNIIRDCYMAIDISGRVGTNNIFLNNIGFNNYYPMPTSGSGIGYSISAGINADPMIVNYQKDGSGDYHLRSGSPAIDSGASRGAPRTDFYGVSRPQGAGYDRGPHEYSENQ